MSDYVTPYVELSAASARTEQEVRAEADKTCPWCGDHPIMRRSSVGGGYLFGCDNDGCDATPITAGKTPAIARAKWNKRT